jgi:Tfp pilus assembly protein PilO
MSAKLRTRPALVALVATLNLVLVAGGWLLLVSPQRQHATQTAQEVQATQAQIAKARAANAPSAIPHQEPIRTANLYRLAKAMPSEVDQPDLLLEIDQVARAAGVTVLSIAPAVPTSADTYSVLPVNLTFSGDFYGLTDVLYRLRSLVAVRHGALDATGRLFSVGSVELTPDGTGTQLTATVTVNAFTYGTVAADTSSTSTSSASTTGTTGTTTTGTTTSGQ